MNRPKRPIRPPQARKKPTRPSGPAQPVMQGPRRRTPLDFPPPVEPPFKVLGTSAERQALIGAALPLEMVVIQGYTREIEEAAARFRGRPEDFWSRHPDLVDGLRKLDEVLAIIQQRLR